MAIDENAVVIGVFRDRTMAEQAIQQLRQEGWEDNHIRTFRHHNAGGVLSSLKQVFGEHDENTSSLEQLGLTDEQNQMYQRELDAGYTVVAVQPQSRQLDVRDILHRNGAYSVFVSPELGGNERVVPIRQEEAEVHKVIVQTGEIRIHKRVITENRTFTVPVTREEVTIERLPLNSKNTEQITADRQDRNNAYEVHHPIGMGGNETNATYLTDNEARRQEEVRTRAVEGYEDEMLRGEGTIRIFVREERVKIEKYSVIVEEIVVRKEVLQEVRHIVEPIRHEEATVEHSGNVPLHSNGFEAL